MPAAPSATGRPPAPPISVATQPGQTAFTRIPVPESSAARIRVSALSATFETLYAGVPPPILVSDPLSLDTFTIRPARLLRSKDRNASHICHAPNKLVSNASCTTLKSAVMPCSQESYKMPALFTSTSSCPKSAVTSLNNRSILCWSVTSS